MKLVWPSRFTRSAKKLGTHNEVYCERNQRAHAILSLRRSHKPNQ